MGEIAFGAEWVKVKLFYTGYIETEVTAMRDDKDPPFPTNAIWKASTWLRGLEEGLPKEDFVKRIAPTLERKPELDSAEVISEHGVRYDQRTLLDDYLRAKRWREDDNKCHRTQVAQLREQIIKLQKQLATTRGQLTKAKRGAK